MTRTGVLTLEFDPCGDTIAPGKALRDGLSAVAQIGNTLWVANDEAVSIERLLLEAGEPARASRHTSFPLHDYLALTAPPKADCAKVEEADVEGMAYDGGYLWLVGSHSLKRKQPRAKDDPRSARGRLATIVRDPNRCLLGRIPVVEEGGTYSLVRADATAGRRAARLRGDGRGNDLTEALARDEHLGRFMTIPGKDNGFDIEGIAASGNRVFLGLRGPVLRRWAVILDLEVREDGRDSSVLRLEKIGEDGRPYRKHFLDLGGRGVRDLCAEGYDLLILAGPVMELDGPMTVFRWPGGMRPDAEAVVPVDELERVLDLPYREGADHPEGLTLFSPDPGAPRSLLVVYDAASAARQAGEHGAIADVFSVGC